LIQTTSVIYWVVAVILGLVLALSANWLSRNWITLEELTPHDATFAIQLLALRLFIGWPNAVYINILSGLQRLEVANALRVVSTTLTIGGGIGILLITESLNTFLWWTIAIALLTLVLHIAACYRYFPGLSLRPRFTLGSVRRVWSFSLDMNVISMLSVLYTQTDRILISRLLPLTVLGYYNAAYTVSNRGVGSIQTFFSGAMMPSFAEDYGRDRMDLLKLRFEKYSQILIYLTTLPTAIFIFWGYDVLRIWTTPEVAEAARVALSVFSLGVLFNSAMSTCYILAVATGHTRIPLAINVAGIVVYLPGIYWLITHWDINGAALAWLLLNVYYIFTLLPLTQRRILKANPLEWLVRNMLPFCASAVFAFGVGRLLVDAQANPGELVIWGVCALSALVYGALGFLSLDTVIRRDIQNTAYRIVARGLGLVGIGARPAPAEEETRP
jgi:O-antigen/teichoic acid export membrane protein